MRSSTPPAPTAAASPRAARPTATRKTAAKTATCTNLGTGAQFPCTEEEYAEQEYADAAHGPEVTQAECRDKTAPGGYLACHAAGFNWGMTEQEMAAGVEEIHAAWKAFERKLLTQEKWDEMFSFERLINPDLIG